MRRGVTLVEVLVALAIFGIVAAAVIALLPAMLRMNSRTAGEQALTAAAKRYLEAVRVQHATPAGFDAPLPAPPGPEATGGHTCEAQSTPQLTRLGTGALGSAAAVPQVAIRRVVLSCRRAGSPEVRPEIRFETEFGRPP